MQAHRRGLQKWKRAHNTPRHWIWSLNCSLFSHQTDLSGIQTILRPPPRVMLQPDALTADTRFNFTSSPLVNKDINVIGNSDDHCRLRGIDSILIYSDINHWCGVLTMGNKDTERERARAPLCHYHLADIPASSDVLQQLCKTQKQLNAPYCIQCTRQVKPKCNFCLYMHCACNYACM